MTPAAPQDVAGRPVMFTVVSPNPAGERGVPRNPAKWACGLLLDAEQLVGDGEERLVLVVEQASQVLRDLAGGAAAEALADQQVPPDRLRDAVAVGGRQVGLEPADDGGHG